MANTAGRSWTLLHLACAVAFAFAIITWFQWLPVPMLPVAPAVPLLMLGRRTRVIGFVMLAFFLGLLRASFIPSPHDSDRLERLHALVLSMPRETPYGRSATVAFDRSGGTIHATAFFKADADIIPFDHLVLDAVERSAERYRNLSDRPQFLTRASAMRTTIAPSSVTVVGRSCLMERLSACRARMLGAFRDTGTPGTSLFVESIFGERSVPDADRALFARTGTIHLLSISGLHFSLTILLAWWVVKLAARIRPRIALAVPLPLLALCAAVPMLVAYGFISGLSLPATRAFALFLAAMSCTLLRTVPSPRALLSLTCVSMLAFEPLLLFDLSFQLTFACMFVLTEVVPSVVMPLQERLSGRPVLTAAFSTLAASGVIALFVFPFTQSLTPHNPFVSMAANVLAIPLYSFLILPFLLLALPVAAVAPSLLPAAFLVPDLAWRLLSGWLSMLDTMTRSLVPAYRPDLLEGVVIVTLAAALLLARERTRIVLCLVAASLLLVPRHPLRETLQGRPFVSFLNTGQGDGAILRTAGGSCVIIDPGGSFRDVNLYSRAWRPFLDTLKPDAIDAVIISHGHPDHWAALGALLDDLPVRHLYAPASMRSMLDPLCSARKLACHEVRDVERLAFDGMSFMLIPPSHPAHTNASLWAFVETPRAQILFAGDTEHRALPSMTQMLPGNAFPLDLFKAPHHGARSSFSPYVYDRIRPSLTVFTAGRHNQWGFPSPVVTSYLDRHGMRWLDTGGEGQVIAFLDRKPLDVVTYGGMAPPDL